MPLDRSEPFSEIIGIPGIAYEQHGRRFTPGGREVLLAWNDDGEPVVTDILEDAEETPNVDAGGSSWETMHWKHLKVLVEGFGEEWTDKAAAVAFLRGRG